MLGCTFTIDMAPTREVSKHRKKIFSSLFMLFFFAVKFISNASLCAADRNIIWMLVSPHFMVEEYKIALTASSEKQRDVLFNEVSIPIPLLSKVPFLFVLGTIKFKTKNIQRVRL
jgi:hypothetical protein